MLVFVGAAAINKTIKHRNTANEKQLSQVINRNGDDIPFYMCSWKSHFGLSYFHQLI